MPIDTISIEEFIRKNQITLKSEYAASNPHMDDSDSMDNYKVTLIRPVHVLHIKSLRDSDAVCSCGTWEYTGVAFDSEKDQYIEGRITEAFLVHVKGRTRNAKVHMTLYFSKGIGHHGAEPKADEVLDCLASDAAGVENAREDFEEWCSEYGYEIDSRKAGRTFKACMHQATRLRNFLGADLYGQLLWHTERQ